MATPGITTVNRLLAVVDDDRAAAASVTAPNARSRPPARTS
jgi:hypothetical protein